MCLFPSTEDGNRISSRNIVFSSYLELRTVDNIKKSVILSKNHLEFTRRNAMLEGNKVTAQVKV
jgi:predicted class III extradiol MEMO1 family dioxygenase